jgi:hypothetical protein
MQEISVNAGGLQRVNTPSAHSPVSLVSPIIAMQSCWNTEREHTCAIAVTLTINPTS